MARLELPVITIVYNNHAYGGPHTRTIANAPSGRMVETGQYVGSYLGNPDMNMASIAAGFGVRGEVCSLLVRTVLVDLHQRSPRKRQKRRGQQR